MCSFCKGCIYKFFGENVSRNKCPNCKVELGGKPTECIVKDITLQNIVDWLIPDFKERDDKLKSQLLQQANERRVKQGKLNPDVLIKKKPKTAIEEMEIEMGNSHDSQKQSKTRQSETNNDINFEFKLVPFQDEDPHLRMEELPKKLKYANKQKTILTVKKHIHNYLEEPIDNIEILCKNFPIGDTHTLDYIKKTKW